VTYRIEFLASAQKQFSKLPAKERKRIDQKILALAEDPRPPGAVAMKGSKKGLLRIRVGNYRVIYTIEDDRLIVVVVRVSHRKDVYQ